MSIIDGLYKKRNEYYNLKSQVEISINLLRESINKMNNVSQKVGQGYSIDGNSADNGELVNIGNNINYIYEKLNNVILPKINVKIKELNNQIENGLLLNN